MAELQMYTTGEAAGILRVTQRTVYNYIKTGELKATKFGNSYRISSVELERFMAEGTGPDYYEKLTSEK